MKEKGIQYGSLGLKRMNVGEAVSFRILFGKLP